MTPEQKAFFEYGEAVANLSFARDFLKLNPSGLKKYEDIVVVKQAACMAWMPKNKRHCANCKYTDCLEWNEPCCECSRCNSYKNVDQWEPRKEEEAADAVGTNPGENPHNSLMSAPAQVGGTEADGKEGE